MKVVGNCVTGHIAPVYGKYGYNKNSFSSYLGNEKEPLYLSFASNDWVIQDILKKYSVAGTEKKQELLTLYKQRVNELIRNYSFSVKDMGKSDRLPYLEIEEDRTSDDYLVCMSGSSEFSSLGCEIWVENEFYPHVKMIQRVETGYGIHKRTDGFFSVPKLPGFKYYVFSNEKTSNDKYYMEEITLDFEYGTGELKSIKKFLDLTELKRFKKGKRQL